MWRLVYPPFLLRLFACWVVAWWAWDLGGIYLQILGVSIQPLRVVLGFSAGGAASWITWKLLADERSDEDPPALVHLVWFVPILLFFVFKLPFPDIFYDTLNYHLLLQNPTSWNFLRDSFFPGGLGTFIWPLADRVFSLPRYFLGYRLGTVVNLFVAWICFLQILNWLGNRKPKAGAITFACLSTEVFLINLGSYYVDLLPVPFLIALVREALEPNRQGALRRAVVCSVLAVALKMASMPIILAVFLLWIARADRISRKLALPVWFVLVIVWVLSPYLLTAFRFTGNPLFPAFNQYFRSPFFPPIFWKDSRWGPRHEPLRFIFFPILATLKRVPLNEAREYAGRLCFYLVSVFVLFRGLWKKEPGLLSAEARLAAGILMMLGLWQITTGYIRYAIIIEILLGIQAALLFFELREQPSTPRRWGMRTLAAIFMLQCGASWVFAFRQHVTLFQLDTHSLPSKFTANVKWVGRDQPSRMPSAVRDRLTQVRGWIIDCPLGGLGALLTPRTPLIQLDIWWEKSSTWEKRPVLFEQLRRQCIDNLVKRGLYAYVSKHRSEECFTRSFQDKAQALGLRLEDKGWVGPIPFLPAGTQNIRLYQVRISAAVKRP